MKIRFQKYVVVIIGIVLSSCIHQRPIGDRQNVDSTNYPNHYSPSTVITFSTITPQKVLISLFDKDGTPMDTLFNGLSIPGNNKVVPNLNKLSAGLYYYKFVSVDTTYLKKMLIIK